VLFRIIMKLLIVEDEKNISEPLKKGFEKEGFAVDLAFDGKDGYSKASINEYDCIVLDLNLPEMDGIDVCRKLREDKNDVPVLMLTARGDISEKVDGLLTGADDYLPKPFNYRELVLRVKALVKRYHNNQVETLEAGSLRLDPLKHVVELNEQPVELNRKEFAILEYLLRNKGEVISQEKLLEHVWNQDVDIFTNTVRTQMLNLRNKIDPDRNLIQTIRGVGYKIM